MNKLVLSVTLILVSVGGACGAVPNGSVERNQVTKLESMIKMPADSGRSATPLMQYRRYYTGIIVRGRRMISGEFVLGFGGKKPGIFAVDREADFPGIMDGGCSVIHVLYDVVAERVVMLACNGRA